MALTLAGVANFTKEVVYLQSFPLFCLYLVLVFGARFWVRKTNPLQLRGVLIAYNALCCLLSFVAFSGFVYVLYTQHQAELYELKWSDSLRPYVLVYWITKCIELLDTVFMVLRHRLRQISFLHVYHHGSMLLLSDYAYQLYPCPPIAFILAINAFIHVVLYFYYALTAWDASSTPGWKRHLTEMQILQFLVDMLFAGYGYMYHKFCIYSIIYGVVMISLFSNFYYHAYLRPRKSLQNGVDKKVK